MKKTIGLLILVTSISCSQTGQQNNSDSQTISNEIKCENSVPFGDINICLPEIDGMTECYSSPTVKERADKLSTEDNLILGVYLNNSTFKQVDKLDEITFDEYIQIYAGKKLKGVKMEQDNLNEIAKSMGGTYFKDNWSIIKDKVKEKLDSMSIGRPILIHSYAIKNNVRTFVMMTKILAGDYEKVQIVIMNLIIIKERYISLAFYKGYDGEESIKNAKSKNDYIVLQFLDENK